MNASRQFWVAIGVLVAALVLFDVVMPRLLRAAPPFVGTAALAVVVFYIVGTIVAANARTSFRLPRVRRPRRLRAVPRDPSDAAKFIDEFERRNRR